MENNNVRVPYSLPIAAQLAKAVAPKVDDEGNVTTMGATADDEATSSMTTYTDD